MRRRRGSEHEQKAAEEKRTGELARAASDIADMNKGIFASEQGSSDVGHH